jgi:hypothetical protein
LDNVSEPSPGSDLRLVAAEAFLLELLGFEPEMRSKLLGEIF